MKQLPHTALFYFCLFFSFFCVFLIPSASADLSMPSTDQIIRDYTEAMGGAAKIRLLNSVRLTGEVYRESDLENAIKIVVIKKFPNKSITYIEVQDVKIVEGFDGETGWRTVELPNGRVTNEILSGDEKRMVMRHAPLTSALLNTDPEVSGIERIEDATIANIKCYRIRVDFQNGEYIIYWLDQSNFRDRRVEYFGREGNLINTITPGDFEFFGGVLFAKQSHLRRPDSEATRILISEVETNIGVLNLLFSPPFDTESVTNE